MCGIVGASTSMGRKALSLALNSIAHRGPDDQRLLESGQMSFGFARLAILELEAGSQPHVLSDNELVTMFNGEIYNYKTLYKYMNVKPITGSDCEVIIHLYIKYGIEQTLTMLDGVFSFVLYDNRITDNLNNQIYIARDPYGVRPLYYLKQIGTENELNQLYGFASELKCLEKIYNIENQNNKQNKFTVNQFKPGTYSVFNLSNKISSCWEPVSENIPYFLPSFSYSNVRLDNEMITKSNTTNSYDDFANAISHALQNSVNKRCLTTERPIACLLSGGLDSSLIAALVSNYYKKNNILTPLETYSIGLQESEDLKYAKVVAEWIESKHTEIIVSEKDMFDAIPEVIYAIESYDTTTVRASIGNYLLGKYISNNSDAKVIFNGDGSDELFGGYLYMNNCPDDIEFDKETRRLLKDI
jgi:asparagine synthase (glutamine-hydrolysing)